MQRCAVMSRRIAVNGASGRYQCALTIVRASSGKEGGAPAGAPTPPASFQKSRVSRPHSIEPPSSTDQSSGASPNSLSFLRTQLIS
jgi:hypothetical protein